MFDAGKKTGGGIAETFAHVFAPTLGSEWEVLNPKIPLADFSRPTQFAASARFQFRLQHAFPRTPRAVPQSDPDEMIELMTENARQFRRIVEQRRVENNAAAAEISRGVDRVATQLTRKQASPRSRESRTERNLDGTALKQG